MKYALGNMLNGAGSLNPDGLSLDLQFATDKTLTARKGPTPVFTRASTATFVGSNGLIQSAAINAARFDHDPGGVACKGLLIEESRTNLIVRSDDFANASWLQLQSTIASNAVTSPDGSTNADTFIEDSTIATHQVIQQAPTLTAGQPYTFSVFAKAASHTSFQIVLSTVAFGSGVFANFILTGAGSVGTSSGVTTKIESFPSGWYRCSVSIASVTGGSNGFVQCLANNNNSSATRLPSYLGTTAQSVYLWGAQLEAGAFPTSYIPTIATGLARSADVCSITGDDFTSVYNESEHTLFAQASGMNHANFGSYLSFDNGTLSEQSAIGGFPSPNTAVCFVVDNGATQASADLPITLNQNNKIAAGMKLNSFQIAVNNVTGTQDGVGTMPTANNLKIGRAWNSNTNSGTYAQVKIFKKRLSNAKLQAITA
jgi:hypothetical protein